MSELNAELSAALRRAVDLQEPPCALDLDLARAQGRRLRRRRQGLQAGAVMAVTALAVVLITGPLSGGDDGAAVPPASPTAPSGTESANDPITTGVSFGWLPNGFHITGGGAQGTLHDDLNAGDGRTALFVTVAPPGTDSNPDCTLEYQSGWQTAGPVHSCDTSTAVPGLKSAKWVAAPGSSQAIAQHYAQLDWRTADDRQAALFASTGGESADQLTTIMVRVAEHVSLGAHRALPMPFHLAKPPTGLPLAYAYTSEGADGVPPGEAANGDPLGAGPAPGVAAGLEYGEIDATTGDSPGLALTVQKADSDAAFPDVYETQVAGQQPSAADIRTTTVDGHSARIVTKAGFQVLVVHDVNGFDVRLGVGGAQALSLINEAGGIVGYYHTITFFQSDPATWTVNVLGR